MLCPVKLGAIFALMYKEALLKAQLIFITKYGGNVRLIDMP